MNKRPLGITLLAIYFALLGIGVLILQLLLATVLTEAFSSITSYPIISMISLAFIGLLSIAAAVTMWLGKPIGWWLGIANLLLSAVRNTWAIIQIQQMASINSDLVGMLSKTYIKHGLRICFSLILIYYFFRPIVLAYFKRVRVPTSA